MATIKSFTSLEQSKKLAEILPIESADYHYIAQGKKSYFYPYFLSSDAIKDYDEEIKYVPCWSLAALYSILPNSEYITTTLSRGGWKVKNPVEFIDGWYCEYEDENNPGNDITVLADNPVDACVEMVIKLHELNLL